MNNFYRRYFAGLITSFGQFKKELADVRIDHRKDDSFERFLNGPQDTLNWSALSALKQAPTFFTSETYLSQYERADWQQADPHMQYFLAALIEVLRKKGVPFYAHSVFRTKDEQNELVAQGASRTPYPRAAHCQGRAGDLVHSLKHWSLTKNEWLQIGKIGLELADRLSIPIKWGGHFGLDDSEIQRGLLGWDPAHWELLDWRNNIVETTKGKPRRLTPRYITNNLKVGKYDK